jgi:hypothetical protein
VSNWTLGIDPGYSGAFVLMNPDGDVEPKFSWKMPLIGDAKARDYDIEAMGLILNSGVSVDAEIYCENFASYALGTTAVKSLVRCVTIIEMLAREYAMPLHIVPSQTWQKIALVGTDKEMKPKARALIAAERIFGAESRKWSEGVRDAALIAWYGSRKA